MLRGGRTGELLTLVGGTLRAGRAGGGSADLRFLWGSGGTLCCGESDSGIVSGRSSKSS